MSYGRFSVVADDLRSASRKADEIGTAVGALEPGAKLRDAADGLPGASSAAALRNVADQWTRDLSQWKTSMLAFGERLDTAAQEYEEAEARARSGYQQSTQSLGMYGPQTDPLHLHGSAPAQPSTATYDWGIAKALLGSSTSKEPAFRLERLPDSELPPAMEGLGPHSLPHLAQTLPDTDLPPGLAEALENQAPAQKPPVP